MSAPPESWLNDALLTAQQVARLLNVSKRTVFRWLRLGKLPQPIRYSKTCLRWKSSAIRAYLDGLQAPLKN